MCIGNNSYGGKGRESRSCIIGALGVCLSSPFSNQATPGTLVRDVLFSNALINFETVISPSPMQTTSHPDFSIKNFGSGVGP